MSTEHVLVQLQRLGMSAYEAKSYVALIGAGHPLNGYEVAKRSGVPRSTVYESLGKLVERGVAYEVKGTGDSTGYVPLPPDHLLERMTREFEESVSDLRAALPSVAVPSQVHLIHNLTGPGPIMTRAEDVISQAGRDVFVSGWPEELNLLAPYLAKADDRRVDISVISFGETENVFGHTFVHRYSSPEVVFENLGCRLLVVVGDRREALIGGFLDGDAWGAYTDNPAVVLVAVEYIRHDIAVHLVADRLPPDVTTEYWTTEPELTRLRSDQGAPAHSLRPRVPPV